MDRDNHCLSTLGASADAPVATWETHLNALRAAIQSPIRGVPVNLPRGLQVESGKSTLAQSSLSAEDDCVASTPQDALSLVTDALLWLKPPSILPDEHQFGEATHDDDSDEAALRAYPSEHTCLVANVVAAVDIIRHGSESRFAARAQIPPVYLSCTCNFDRDETTGTLSAASLHGQPKLRALFCPHSHYSQGIVPRCPGVALALLNLVYEYVLIPGEIFSVEIAIAEHQERCQEEEAMYPEVRFALDPSHGTDWLGYFREMFALDQLYEVWRGDEYLYNTMLPPEDPKLSVCPVYTLRRSSLSRFEHDALDAACITHSALDTELAAPSEPIKGGCVVVFRTESPECEPFGAWLLYLIVAGEIVIVDLQNSTVHRSLQRTVDRLEWETPPRQEVYFAKFNSKDWF